MAQHTAAEIRELVDQRCDQFEAAWTRGEHPQIDRLLKAVPADVRAELCGELVAVEMELRARAGDLPSVDAYLEQFPQYAETIEGRFAEFQSWVQSTSAIDESMRSRVLAAQQDTERQTLETKKWTDGNAVPLVPADRVLSDFDTDSGQTIGRYHVVRKLGQGGMGSVLLARDPLLDRLVALKLPHFQTDDGPAVIERFYREARSMAAVHHPNLCPIFDVGEADGHPYLAMAYVDGQSLAEKIELGQPLDAAQAARLVRTLALAVQTIHEAGVVHRDLKPSNVMIDRRGQPMVTDFGLATRDRPNEAELTRSGAMIGSPAYMAPEQVRGQIDQIGPRTDVYALGVILYQLLCGRRPFEGAAASVFGKIESGARPTPQSKLAKVSRKLETVCLRAMAHKSADRYQTAAELAAALEPFAREQKSTPGKTARPRPRPRRRIAPFAAGLVLVAVAAGVLAWLWAAGLLFRVETAEGDLVVKIRDDKFAASVQERELTFTNTETKETYTIRLQDNESAKRLDAGEYRFELETATGLRTTTDRFTIAAGDKTQVEVWWEPRVVGQQTSRPPVTLDDPAVEHSDLPLVKIFEGATGPVTSLGYTGDGRALVSGDHGGAVRIWDVESATQRCLGEGLDPVKAVAVSADQKSIAVGTVGRGVSILRLGDGQSLRTLADDMRHVLGLDFSPDGRWLLATTYGGTALAWNLDQQGEAKRLIEGGGRLEAVGFSRDGTAALVAGGQLGLSVWDVPQWNRRVAIADGYAVAAISPSGDRVVTRGAVFDSTSGEVVVRYDASQFPLEVAFTPDGRHIVSCETSFLLTIVEAATGKSVARVEMNTSSMNALAVSPDGKSVVTAGGHAYNSETKEFVDSGDYTIRMWRLPESVWPKAAVARAEIERHSDDPPPTTAAPEPPPVDIDPAARITVGTTADVVDGDCSSIASLIDQPGRDGAISLREAIIAANHTAGDNTVAVDIDGVITLTIAGSDEDEAASGDLDIVSNITIQGGGARKTIVDGGGIDRVFEVCASDVRVQFNDLTIRNGNAVYGGGCHIGGANSAINFDRVRVTGNRTKENAGGLSIAGDDETMVVNIRDSLIDNNSSEGINAGGGSGIVVHPGGTVSIVNTSISSNKGLGTAGITAQFNRGGSVQVVNSTITGNLSTYPKAGGVQKNDHVRGTVTLTNSIVAGNSGDQFLGEAGGRIKSGGHNVIGPGRADFDMADSDRVFEGAIETLLLPLADNGGPTDTHALAPGSPAINAGANQAAEDAKLTTDQRGEGFDRIVDGTVDIGAFEFARE